MGVHCNATNSFFYANGIKIQQFKAKCSEISHIHCVLETLREKLQSISWKLLNWNEWRVHNYTVSYDETIDASNIVIFYWRYHYIYNIYIYTYSDIFNSDIPLALGLIGRDGGLSTLYHSCGFACQQRVLKTFPGPGYLHSDAGVVWLWHSLVNLDIYTYIHLLYLAN